MHHLIFDCCMTTMKENGKKKRKERVSKQKGMKYNFGLREVLAGERVIG